MRHIELVSLEISSRWVLVKIEAAVLMLSSIFFISCNGQYSGSCVIRNLVLCRVVLTMLPENGLLQICQGMVSMILDWFASTATCMWMHQMWSMLEALVTFWQSVLPWRLIICFANAFAGRTPISCFTTFSVRTRHNIGSSRPHWQNTRRSSSESLTPRSWPNPSWWLSRTSLANVKEMSHVNEMRTFLPSSPRILRDF